MAALLVTPATTSGATTAPWVGTSWGVSDDQGFGGLVGLGVARSGQADLFLNQQVSFSDPQPLRVLGGQRRPPNRTWEEREALRGNARVVRTNGEGRVLVVWHAVSPQGVRIEASLVGELVEPLEMLEESPLSHEAAFSNTGLTVVAIGDRDGLRVFERPSGGRWSSARILVTGKPVGQSIMAINDAGDVVIGWPSGPRSNRLRFARRGVGGGWREQASIGPIRRQWHLALDPMGVAHVVTGVQPGGIIAARNVPGRRGWATREIAPRGGGFGVLGLGLDDAGRALALFAAPDGSLRLSSRAAAHRWSALRPVPRRTTDANPFAGLAVGALGHVAITTSSFEAFHVQDRDPFGRWSPPRAALRDPDAGAMAAPRVELNGAGDIAAAWTTGFSNTAMNGFAIARTAPPPPKLRAAAIARPAGGDRPPLRFTLDRAGPVLVSVRAVGAQRPAAAVIVRGRRGAQRLAWPQPLAVAIRRPGTYRVTFATAARSGGPAGERSAVVRIR